MQGNLRERLAAVGRVTLRILDLIVTALIAHHVEYPEEYGWARELPW